MKYTTVSIPIALAAKIDEVVKEDATYTNRADVVKDTLRDFFKNREKEKLTDRR